MLKKNAQKKCSKKLKKRNFYSSSAMTLMLDGTFLSTAQYSGCFPSPVLLRSDSSRSNFSVDLGGVLAFSVRRRRCVDTDDILLDSRATELSLGENGKKVINCCLMNHCPEREGKNKSIKSPLLYCLWLPVSLVFDTHTHVFPSPVSVCVDQVARFFFVWIIAHPRRHLPLFIFFCSRAAKCTLENNRSNNIDRCLFHKFCPLKRVLSINVHNPLQLLTTNDTLNYRTFLNQIHCYLELLLLLQQNLVCTATTLSLSMGSNKCCGNWQANGLPAFDPHSESTVPWTLTRPLRLAKVSFFELSA